MAFNVKMADGTVLRSEAPLSGEEVLAMAGRGGKSSVVAWRVNHYLRPLNWILEEDADVEFVDVSSFEGMEVYRRTLSFILVLAVRKVLGLDLLIRHSVSEGYYCELLGAAATPEIVSRIRDVMEKIVKSNLPIDREVLPLDKARRIFERQGNLDKERLLLWSAIDPVVVYRCLDTYGYFYAPLASETGMVGVFDLVPFPPGMVLRFPTVTSPNELPPFHSPKRLVEVFGEYSQWLDILGVGTMDSLHEQVVEGHALDLILISEALHGERFAQIAREIVQREKVRLVCIAGPSGSGKTTMAHRLSVQLQVCGKKPVVISLDNYFVPREQTPRDEYGNYDFDALEALDLGLINEQLTALMSGEEVQLPVFNFITGERHWGRRLRLDGTGMILIEGIHGLNERLSGAVADELKYRIFVSPLTGVNLDRHNRTSTTDNRLLRRLVRDYRVRGHSAEETLRQWPSVIRQAQQHIFPYQEVADTMFNSALIYELSVLKGYAEPLLRAIRDTSPVYGEAQRLLSMLRHVPVIPSDNVPNLSILREFIGGSCFEE